MIWYLLYPFRGTTEAPILAPTHPFRSAFTRYGRYAARHIITTLLISVAVATILIYPFPFLYTTDFINGASNLPHHVWTDAQPLQEKSGFEPDVLMRSIWVHGSYMQALDKDVLLGALELQNELLGPTVYFNPRQTPGTVDPPDPSAASLEPVERDYFHVVNGLTNSSWFFHSPLQYWSCSEFLLQDDNDIVGTVNARKTQPTSVNVTLRHSIVFSGKRFEDRRLVAADALVITLIHLRDSPVGRIWDEKVKALAAKATDKWQVYTPEESGSRGGQLYEFQFRPMSMQDKLALAIAYLLVLTYSLVSLSKLRAVKSKIGLIVTVIAQIVLSILSSLTICALFKIDLSRIPRFGYPLVVFAMSLENVFRLINAVIMTAPEMSTSNRIGHAFGETAPIALANVGQNLVILIGLSGMVSPGVSAFCTFAAVALVVDFFYLSTFFLAVLSVDVRRTELSDALAKASFRNRNRRSSADGRSGRSWVDAMLQGKIAMSTRIAGTIVMVGFVLIAQWHFFENESLFSTISRIVQVAPKFKDMAPPRSSLLVDVHQARSPTSWLRLQDHETAREVIHVIKPEAHSYVAMVFHPFVFVLKGSDRMPSIKERLFLPAVYDFARHQSAPFIATVLFVAAAVRLLMNYLLWDELADTDVFLGSGHDSLLSVKTLSRGHTLDVALLAGSADGYIISVGLDRVTRIWDVKSGGACYVLGEHDNPPKVIFPIIAMCIDDATHWLALLTSDHVALWNLAERKWASPINIEPQRHRPEAFFFGSDEQASIPPLVLVRRDGRLVELRADAGPVNTLSITDGATIVSAGSLTDVDSVKVLASTRDGEVRLASQIDSQWTSYAIPMNNTPGQEYVSCAALTEVGFFLIVRSQSVDIADSRTLRSIHSFKTEPIHPKTLKCYHSRPRRSQCGAVGLAILTFAYVNAYTRDLVVQTYSPQRDGDYFCLRDPSSPEENTCRQWQEAKENKRLINNPGVWDALPSGMLVGVRKNAAVKPISNGNVPSLRPIQGLRRRRRGEAQQPPEPSRTYTPQDWEVWMFSHFGKQETWERTPLCPELDDDEHLYATALGPMVRVGRSSVAIGLSNVIKVIAVGQKRFGPDDDGLPGDGMPTMNTRRRKGPTALRGRPTILQSERIF